MANNYYRCEDCGRLVDSDDAQHIGSNIYCGDCAPSRIAIHDYGYKPAPKFYGSANSNAPFMGVELEVDHGSKCTDCARTLTKLNKPDVLLYCKHDGSLDEGVEIVTHPMTLEYHMNEMKWKDIISTLRDTTSNLMMPVHVDSMFTTAKKPWVMNGMLL
jgi:DNA-directed RNA polymerase subunit RPC12/RpoP